MAMLFKEYTLDGNSIEEISAGLQAYLKDLRMDRRNIHRIRLTVEALLLNVMDAPDRCETVSIGLGRRFGRHIFSLRYEMEPFDPIEKGDDPWVEELMRALDFFPSWRCKNRANTVSLVLKNGPKPGTLFFVLAAVFAAALLGVVGLRFPAALRQVLDEALLTPIADGFMGLLKTFSGLMIVLTICSGILGIGDPAFLGRLGKSVLAQFIGISFAAGALATALVLPFLHVDLSASAQGQASQFVGISRMFFDILPSNIVEPFQSGNSLQLIVIAIMLGIGLLTIGEKGSRLCNLVNDATILMQHIVSSICALVPVFVFAMLLRQIWIGEAKMLLSFLRPLLLIIGAIVTMTVLQLLLSAFRLKCSPLLLLKKVLPTFLIAFSTASSISAMPLGMKTCEKKMGVDKNMVSFLYPLGLVIYMPDTIVYFAVLSCTFADLYQVEISLPWLITEVIITTMLAIAMPPIPGGDIMCYAILFSSLGIPAQALIPATAAGIVLDYLDTGINTVLLILQITAGAVGLNSLDRKVLLRE